MNKIEVKDSVLSNELVLDCDTLIVYRNNTGSIDFKISNNIRVFIYMDSCDIDIDCDINSDFVLNIFSYNSSLDIDLNLNKDGICLRYVYSTVNKDDNKYLININHNEKSQISKVINNGLNLDDKRLDFIVNAIVPKESINTETNQNNKIILMGNNNCKIEPNLIIDNDDIIANHSAYLGGFKKDVLFYLESRGLNYEDAIKLLSRSFIMGSMDISYLEKNIILDKLDMYWR